MTASEEVAATATGAATALATGEAEMREGNGSKATVGGIGLEFNVEGPDTLPAPPKLLLERGRTIRRENVNTAVYEEQKTYRQALGGSSPDRAWKMLPRCRYLGSWWGNCKDAD